MASINLTDYEKVAVIVRCGTGKLGKRTDISHDTLWKWRIETVEPARCALVRYDPSGRWQVSFKGIIGEDYDLETAARYALEQGRDVQVTRNYPVRLDAPNE